MRGEWGKNPIEKLEKGREKKSVPLCSHDSWTIFLVEVSNRKISARRPLIPAVHSFHQIVNVQRVLVFIQTFFHVAALQGFVCNFGSVMSNDNKEESRKNFLFTFWSSVNVHASRRNGRVGISSKMVRACTETRWKRNPYQSKHCDPFIKFLMD